MRTPVKHLFLLFTFITATASAQLQSVKIGVNGLTCSQCTRSTELSLRKLDFVKEVEMDLEHTNGVITFKEGAVVSFEKIAQAVVDAGFSVRYLNIVYKFDNESVPEGACLQTEQWIFHFIEPETPVLNGEEELQLIGEAYLTPKEFKKWKNVIKDPCQTVGSTTYYVKL